MKKIFVILVVSVQTLMFGILLFILPGCNNDPEDEELVKQTDTTYSIFRKDTIVVENATTTFNK